MFSPFHVEGIIRRTVKGKPVDTGQISVNEETGQRGSRLYVDGGMKNLDHDNMTFIKIFSRRDDWAKLSPSARQLMLYLVFHVKVNSDQIILRADHVRRWTGLSRNKYYEAMGELEGADKMLARQEGSNCRYYINPNYFYNGNRVRLYQKVKAPI